MFWTETFHDSLGKWMGFRRRAWGQLVPQQVILSHSPGDRGESIMANKDGIWRTQWRSQLGVVPLSLSATLLPRIACARHTSAPVLTRGPCVDPLNAHSHLQGWNSAYPRFAREKTNVRRITCSRSQAEKGRRRNSCPFYKPW